MFVKRYKITWKHPIEKINCCLDTKKKFRLWYREENKRHALYLLLPRRWRHFLAKMLAQPPIRLHQYLIRRHPGPCFLSWPLQVSLNLFTFPSRRRRHDPRFALTGRFMTDSQSTVTKQDKRLNAVYIILTYISTGRMVTSHNSR